MIMANAMVWVNGRLIVEGGLRMHGNDKRFPRSGGSFLLRLWSLIEQIQRVASHQTRIEAFGVA